MSFFIKTGHSAKFGSYTMMDLRANTIVDLQLVQVSDHIVAVTTVMTDSEFERTLI